MEESCCPENLQKNVLVVLLKIVGVKNIVGASEVEFRVRNKDIHPVWDVCFGYGN